MASCLDPYSNNYGNCGSHLSTYVSVGVIIPGIIVIILALVYYYFRCRAKSLRRQGQQPIQMGVVTPIHNNDEQQQPPYNPPQHPPSEADPSDKPPSYEQSIQQLSETQPRVSNLPQGQEAPRTRY